MKKLFVLVLIIAAGLAVWSAFALWAGIYSVYSYPPSKEHPDGATLLVSRDEWEPMFNSPDYRPPKREETNQGIIQYEKVNISRRPIDTRTIVKLPYIEWAYKKSLEPQNSN